MTSERKRQANRANAQASLGPKTTNGKARSAQNSFRSLAEEVEQWAQRIAGAGTDPELLAHPRRVVEAQIEVRRVRTYRLL